MTATITKQQTPVDSAGTAGHSPCLLFTFLWHVRGEIVRKISNKKRKLLLSLESRLCHRMFCWDSQVKGYFATADSRTDTGCLEGHSYDPQAAGAPASLHFAWPL